MRNQTRLLLAALVFLVSAQATALEPKFRAQGGAQWHALRCPVREALFWGDRGGAKSFTKLLVYAREIGKGYGSAWRGIYFRRQYDDLHDVIEKAHKLFGEFQNSRFYASASDLMWEFAGGEQLLFRAAKRREDVDDYQGHEYPFIAFEELTQWPDDYIYRNMFACNRATGAAADMPRWIRSSTNSMGPGHNWVKAHFALPQMSGKVQTGLVDSHGSPLPDRVAIELPRAENKILMRDDPTYEAGIRIAAENDPNKYRSWVLGGAAAWDITSGGMFDDIWITHREYIEVEPFDIPAGWRIDRSYDWGSSKPFAVLWWAESDGSDLKLRNGRTRSTVRGDLFLIAEWYGWTGKANEGVRMLSSDITKGIIEREIAMGLYGRVEPGPADTSIFTAAEPGKSSISVDMAAPVRLDDGKVYPGVTWVEADKSSGSRVDGWQAMRTMFAATKAKPGCAREGKGLFIVKTCAQFLRTVPTISRHETKTDDVDTDLEDHIADAARYRVRAKHIPKVTPKRTGIY